MRLHVKGRGGQGLQGILGEAGEEMSVCDICGSERVEERWLTERFGYKDIVVEVKFRAMVCADCGEDYTTGEQGKALVQALEDAIDGAEAKEALEEE